MGDGVNEDIKEKLQLTYRYGCKYVSSCLIFGENASRSTDRDKVEYLWIGAKRKEVRNMFGEINALRLDRNASIDKCLKKSKK